MDGDYLKARGHFTKSFINGRMAEKIKSVVGVLSSYTKSDIEKIVKLLGYPSIKDRM